MSRLSTTLRRLRPAHLAAVWLFLLIGVELGARWAGVFEIMGFTPNEHWGYLMTPNQEVWSYGIPLRINRLGLRGPALRPKRPAGPLRILFVGDSTAYGGGRIAEADLFCRRIERQVQKAGFDAEAVNLSAPGWAPGNWAGYIGARGFLHADVLVLCLSQDCLRRPFSKMAYHGFLESPPWLRVHCLATKIVSLLRPPALSPPHDPERTEAANRAILRRIQKRFEGRPVLALLLPSQPGHRNKARWEPILEEMRPETTVVDCRAALDRQDLYLDFLHLLPEGHAIVAEKTTRALLPLLRETASETE